MKVLTGIAAATIALGLAAGSAFASEYQYHDENTTQHVGRTTVPAMGSRPSQVAPTGLHDENTSQHIGRTTSPAMSAKPSTPVRPDYHDENHSVHVGSR